MYHPQVYYRHLPEYRRTYAFMAVERKKLSAAMKNLKNGVEAEFTLLLGVAHVHPNDRYCKATGRVTALNDMKLTVGTLELAHVNQHGTLYQVRVGRDLVRYFRKHRKPYAKFDSLLPDYCFIK